jgi:hypothetical protein
VQRLTINRRNVAFRNSVDGCSERNGLTAASARLRNVLNGTAIGRQEVWRLEGARTNGPIPGGREVQRTIVFVDIDATSGSQISTARKVKTYPIDNGESLEEIYDENAAQ